MLWSVLAWFTDNTVAGWTSTMGTIGLIGAVQLICIGLLGEYLSRLFIGSQGRPTYLIGYDSASRRRGGNVRRTRASGVFPADLFTRWTGRRVTTSVASTLGVPGTGGSCGG